MTNKKREKSAYRKKLGRYHLSRSDLIALEKILWVYADAREMKHARVSSIPKGRKHMPRRIIDRHVSVGQYRPFHISIGWGELGVHFAGVDWIYQEDSIKFLKKPGYSNHTRYFELAAWPGIKVTLTPLSTTIYAQTHYATGLELSVLRSVISKTEAYFAAMPQNKLNKIVLR